ncbi:MAG: hypothetical protein SO073_00265 [Candidatus Onthomonas sp.]|nr:hypothetical protein [Candidatus Onthomonas sp.]
MKDENKENKVTEPVVQPEETPELLEELEDTAEFDLEAILEEYVGQPVEEESEEEPEPVEAAAEEPPEPDEEETTEPEAAEETEPESEPEEDAESTEDAEAPEDAAQAEETGEAEDAQEAEPSEASAEEAESKPASQEPTGEDPEETARFIQEQVSSALGDTYSEETLREQETRAAQIRKARERKEAQEARQQRREERVDSVRKWVHSHRKKKKPAPPEPQDNVIQMPVSKLKPIRDKINNLNEKAMQYADEMYSQSETPEMEEQEAPEAQVERVPRKQKIRRERKPKRVYKPEPDIPPGELAKRYSKGLKNMRLRLKWLLALCAVMFYLTFATEGPLPLPAGLAEQPRLMAGILLWCLGVACLLGLDALWMGITAIRRKRMGTHTIMSCAVIFTLLDGLWYCLIGREGGLPLAAPAALILLGCLWGTYDRKKGLAKTCSTASLSSSPYRVTLDHDEWKGGSAFCKEQGTTEQFGSQIQSPDGAMRVYQLFVPLILVAVVLFALISSCGRMHPERFLWCLSVILVAATPMSGMLAYSQPFLRLTHRLNNSVALAGWDGVLSMEEGEAYVLLKDDDLFPVGSVKSQGIKTFHGVSLERVTSCTASMIRLSGSGLTKLFSDLVQVQGGFFRRVDSMTYHEAGGMIATIRGDQVMIGTAGFMSVMHIPLKQGEYVKEAIFCAINGQLQGIFALKYDQSRAVRPAFQALLQAGVKPVLATRDFNITPAMLHRRFKLPVNRMEYPNVRRRHELSEPGQGHNRVLGALIRRDGLGPYTDAIIGARRLHKVVRLNTILALAASAVGAILTFYLTFIAAYLSLSAFNMMLFLLLWLVPNLLISAAVDRF